MDLMEIPAARTRHPSIGLTPLIDVVFILLVFFMLVVQFKTFQQTTLATVQSTNAPIAQTDDNLIITLKNSGDCELEGLLGDCETVLSNLGRTDGETVFIGFDAEVPLRRIVDFQERVLGSGLTSSLALPVEGVSN